MTLIQKLTLGFIGVALLLALMGGIQIFFIHEIHGEVREIANSNVGEVHNSIDIAYRVALIGSDLNEYLLESVSKSKNPELAFKQQILADWAQVNETVANLKRATENGITLADDDDEEAGEESEMEAIADLEVLLQEYKELIGWTFATVNTQGGQVAVDTFLQNHLRLEEQIRAGSKDLFSDALDEIQIAVGQVGDSVERSISMTAGLTAVAFALAITIGFLVSRPLLRRIGQLKTATQELQNGNLEVQISSIQAKDEIADLAHSFNAMVRDLKHSMASIDDLNKQIRKRVRAEAALQQAHDELDARVKQRTLDLEQARIEAESANRTKSEFLANMSHELRTPLNHIIGFTELIVSEKLGSLNEMQGEYLSDSLTSSHHLLALINDILDLSKVEAGKLELILAKVNLKALMNNCLVMFKEKAMQHRIEVVLDANHAPESILADEIKLKQIIFNLLSNAFKFTPDAGCIRVRAWKLNGAADSWPQGMALPGKADPTKAWALTVTDNGVGIPVEDLEKIFSPFKQGANQDRNLEGTGLGLTLTRRMVQLHGGVIRAESSGRDQGATFTIVLPEVAEIPAS